MIKYEILSKDLSSSMSCSVIINPLLLLSVFLYTTGLVYVSTSVWVSCLWVYDSVQSTKQPIRAIPIPEAKTLTQETLSLCPGWLAPTLPTCSNNTLKICRHFYPYFLLMKTGQTCSCLGVDSQSNTSWQLSLTTDFSGNKIIVRLAGILIGLPLVGVACHRVVLKSCDRTGSASIGLQRKGFKKAGLYVDIERNLHQNLLIYFNPKFLDSNSS